MIAAHGVRLVVTESALEIHPDALAAALGGTSEPEIIALDTISGATIRPGDSWDEGVVDIVAGDTTRQIRFVPGDVAGPEQLSDLISAAQAGKSVSAIPGLNFVALDVETANQNWGSICQIGLVRVEDGAITKRVSWLCQPPERLNHFDAGNVACHGITADDVVEMPSISERLRDTADFVGDFPLVAHNAYFDASALRYAALETGQSVSSFTFACTLAQSRAAQLGVTNHKLPTVAEFFGVPLDRHHDAEADAAACAGIMLGLARRAHHRGPLQEFVHASGFSMGSIGDQRVTPVLKDYSGAESAMQAQAPAETPSRAQTHAPDSSRPAPWQSVATPETVPEPALDADPESPLYGQHVTLTGEFEPYDKGQLWDGIASQGGQVGKNVTKKTTILVTGEWASMTSKEKRARELMDKGQDIQIWPAEKLLSTLGLEEEPPF